MKKPNHIKYKTKESKFEYARFVMAVKFPDGEIRVIEVQNDKFAKQVALILNKVGCEVLVGWAE